VVAAEKAKRRYVDTKTRFEGVYARHSLNCNLALGLKRCNCEPSYYGTVWDDEVGRNRRTPRVDDIGQARNERADLFAEVKQRRRSRRSGELDTELARPIGRRASRTRLRDAHPEFIDACRQGIALNKFGRTYANKAVKDLDSSLNRLPPWLRSKYLDEISDQDFQRVVDDLRAEDPPLSSSRINSVINAARSLSRWAQKRGKAPSKLAHSVDLPANDASGEHRIATPGEFAHLLDQLAAEDALPWALAGYGSARAQEIEYLDWPEVDFGANALLLAADEEAKKSEAARRIVPMVRQLRDRLQTEWIRQGEPASGRVCPPRRADNKSGCISLNALQKRRFPVWEELDLEPIGLHDSRHTCATWLDHARVSPKVASAFMGHKAPKPQADAAPITLRRYTHLLAGELERARDQLQRFLDEREAEEAERSSKLAAAA
jgi:integrase